MMRFLQRRVLWDVFRSTLAFSLSLSLSLALVLLFSLSSHSRCLQSPHLPFPFPLLSFLPPPLGASSRSESASRHHSLCVESGGGRAAGSQREVPCFSQSVTIGYYPLLPVAMRGRCHVSYTAHAAQGLQLMGVIKRYSALVCGKGGGLGAVPAPPDGAGGKGNASFPGGDAAGCMAAPSGAADSAAKRQKT